MRHDRTFAGGSLKTGAKLGAYEIHVLLGVGGMGKNDVKGMEGETIYALCDVDLKAAEDSFQAYPKAKRYRDYREMLDKERNSIDAVTISTPDHSHTAAGLL